MKLTDLVDGAHAVVRGDDRVDHTMREIAVLKALATASGQMLSRNELLAAAWNDEPDLHETVVDVNIHDLRRNLDPPLARRWEHEAAIDTLVVVS